MRGGILAALGMLLVAGNPSGDIAPNRVESNRVQKPARRAAQERRAEALVDKVKKSIDDGIRYLREQQQGGNWEKKLGDAIYPGGSTALALLALLNAGVPPNDPAIQRGLEYLRELQPSHTYVRALQTMVYVEAKEDKDKNRIIDNVNWLIKARAFSGGKFNGYSYQMPVGGTSDGSNSQFGALGLWYGKQGGAVIKREIWEGIRDYYV